MIHFASVSSVSDIGGIFVFTEHDNVTLHLVPLGWLASSLLLSVFSSFQQLCIEGSWYSSGFKAKAKSGKAGALSVVLLHDSNAWDLSVCSCQDAHTFSIGRGEGLTYLGSTDLCLSAL